MEVAGSIPAPAYMRESIEPQTSDRFFATVTLAGPAVIDKVTGWRDPQPTFEEAENVAYEANCREWESRKLERESD